MEDLDQDLKQIKKYFESNLKGEVMEIEEENQILEILEKTKEYLPEIINIILLEILKSEKYSENELSIFYDNLSSILVELQEKEFLKEKELIECLDEELLSNIGLIDKRAFMKKRIRFFTKKYYEQTKYNLIGENSEGYSLFLTKLVLLQDYKNSDELDKIFKEIIGYYDLDPNRIVDILIEFLRCFNFKFDFNTPLQEEGIIHFILKFFQEVGKEKVKKLCFNKLTNMLEKEKGRSLLTVISFLAKYDFLDAQEIWYLLKPDEGSVIEDFENKRKANFELMKNIFVLEIETSEEMSLKKEDNIKKLKNDVNSKLIKNHKLAFLEFLLKLNNFTDFYKIYEKINYSFYFDSLDSFLSIIFNLTLYYINPLYRLTKNEKVKTNSVFRHEKELKPFEEATLNTENIKLFFETLIKLLAISQSNLFYSVELYEKIVDILIYLKNKFGIMSEMKLIIQKFLLPSLMVMNLSLKNREKGYNILKRLLLDLDYLVRFEIYGKTMSEEIYDNYYITNFSLIEDTKKFIRNICDGEEHLDFNISKINNLAQTNPFFTFSIFIKNVKLFKNLIHSICEASIKINDICKDIFMYMILNEFEKSEKYCIPIRDNDNVAPWFYNLCALLSKFIRFNYTVDLKVVFIFILNKLKVDEGDYFLFLILVENIFREFLGFEIVHNLNPEQFVGVLGGINLKASIFHFQNNFYSNAINRKSLFKILEEEKEILNEEVEFSFFWILYIYICKQSVRISYKLTTFTLQFVNRFIDFSNDLKNLMIIFNNICFEKTENFSSENNIKKLTFIAKNQIGLVTTDVLTICRTLLREEFEFISNDAFELFKNLIQSNLQNIFKEKKNSLGRLFEKEIKNVIDCTSPEFDFLILYWLIEHFDIYSPLEIYTVHITKIQNKIEELKKQNETDKMASKIQHQEIILKKIEEEQNKQKLQMEVFKSFIKNHPIFNKTKNKLSFIVLQGFILRYSLSIQESFLTVKFIEYFNFPYSENFCVFLDTVFAIINRFLSCLTAMTENESVNFGYLLIFFFEYKKYLNDDILLKDKIVEYLKSCNFLEKENLVLEKFQNNITDLENVKKVVIRKFTKMAENLTSEFSRNSIVYIKNLIKFLLTILPIFPKSKKHIEIILLMIKNGESIIEKYEDIKNRCVTLKKTLFQQLENFDNEKLIKISNPKEETKKEKLTKNNDKKKTNKIETQSNLRNHKSRNYNPPDSDKESNLQNKDNISVSKKSNLSKKVKETTYNYSNRSNTRSRRY